MIAFTYADNSEAVARSLAAFQDVLADNTPALREVADDFREMIAQQFASEGRAEGTPWPARRRPGGADIAFVAMSAKRKPQTWQKTAMSAPPNKWHPLLVRTGALRDSLIGPTVLGHVEEVSDQELTLGTRVPYALFHQLGTRHMPARPIIVLTGARAERWAEIVRGAIEEKAVLLGSKELGGGK